MAQKTYMVCKNFMKKISLRQTLIHLELRCPPTYPQVLLNNLRNIRQVPNLATLEKLDYLGFKVHHLTFQGLTIFNDSSLRNPN